MEGNSHSTTALFQLLRIALQGEQAFSIPIGINWSEVFDLSVKQGVPNIAYDGLQVVLDNSLNSRIEFDSPEMEIIRYKWIGYGMCAEKKYNEYRKIVSELARFYYDNGFHMLLFKGYGLSLYYPIPEHRPTGDIDIFVTKDGIENAQSYSDKIIYDKLGLVPIKQEIGHHSSFVIHGTTVENHYEFSNTYWKSSKSIKFEELLQSMSHKNCKEYVLLGNKFYTPSPTFNAIYLMWHMAVHFSGSQICLRQLCDWMLFLQSEKDGVDWVKVQAVYKEYGLTRFANAINCILVDYLGMSPFDNLQLIEDYEYEDRVLDDILQEKNVKSFRHKLKRYPQSQWKYKLLGQPHWTKMFFRSVFLHIFHKWDIEERPLF